MYRVSSRSPQPRKTLGLFTDWLKDPYQNALTSAIARACAEFDVNLLCFAGGHLDAKGSDWSRRTILYDYAGAHNLDALIVMGANVGTLVGPDALREYLGRFDVANKVSLAYRLEGIPSVLVDNSIGLRQAIEHLVDEHQRKNIGFIRGPVVNTEAEERYRVYQTVLAERGLALDPRRVMVGDFLRPSGATAMQAILESGARLDAIVAANDLMALGALDVLKAEGVKVPEDVSIVGFDDVDEARLAIPQLTTVRQPFRLLGREAVKTALSLIEGKEPPSEVTVPTQVVARRSCGCGANTWDETERLSGIIDASATSAEIRQRFSEGFAALAGDGFAITRETAVELFELVVGEIERGVTGEFARQMADLIRSNPLELLGPANRLMTVVLRSLQQWISADAERRQRADQVSKQLRASVGDIGELAQGTQRVRLQRMLFELSELCKDLMAAENLDGIRLALDRRLPALGIRTGYLSLYEDPASPQTASRLIWAKNWRDHGVTKAVGQTFESKALVPFGSIFRDHRESLILEPLFMGDTPLGTLALALGPNDGIVYEAIREQVSGALRIVRLIDRQAAEKG
jgi:DNA-binding LacI/PurR family transcriptional regulator